MPAVASRRFPQSLQICALGPTHFSSAGMSRTYAWNPNRQRHGFFFAIDRNYAPCIVPSAGRASRGSSGDKTRAHLVKHPVVD
jgi:hypothetical protein